MLQTGCSRETGPKRAADSLYQRNRAKNVADSLHQWNRTKDTLQTAYISETGSKTRYRQHTSVKQDRRHVTDSLHQWNRTGQGRCTSGDLVSQQALPLYVYSSWLIVVSSPTLAEWCRVTRMAVGEFSRMFCVLALVWLLGFSVGCVFGQNGGHSFVYTREYLLNLRDLAIRGLDLQNIDFPFEMLPSCSSTHSDSSHRNRQGKKRKRGKKGGVRQKSKKMKGGRAPLPSVILSNVRSLRSKTDELQANVSYMHEYSEACLLAFTETWLDDRVHNHELTVDRFGAPIRLDRNKVDTGKEQGGGVCFYVNKKWCNTVFVREALCMPDIELLSISLHPFYLPRNSPSCFSRLWTFIHMQMLRERLNTLQITFINWILYLLMLQNSYLGTLTIALWIKLWKRTIDTSPVQLFQQDNWRVLAQCLARTRPLHYLPLGSADHNSVLLALSLSMCSTWWKPWRTGPRTVLPVCRGVLTALTGKCLIKCVPVSMN